MSKRDITLFFEDIIEATELISEYIGDYSKEEFQNDRKTIDAVVRNIEIIGEAVSKIPDKFREKYPHIPWKKIVGVRNIVIHNYFGVDTNTLWFIVREQLPAFKSEVSQIIQEITDTSQQTNSD